MRQDPPELISIDDACTLLKIHRATVYRLIADGGVRRYRRGFDRHTYIETEVVRSWMWTRGVDLDVDLIQPGSFPPRVPPPPLLSTAKPGDLGSLIRLMREQQGLTAGQLAVAAKLSPSAISRIESGELDPSLATMRRIARALGAEALVGLRWADGDRVASISPPNLHEGSQADQLHPGPQESHQAASSGSGG